MLQRKSMYQFVGHAKYLELPEAAIIISLLKIQMRSN
ncbi:uncharacterized protein METZ01_LOCUS302770 [marine metagenome]|uniref:Uncharacterized protein n=1 Tax=marine metagenome TaxID=408172 RepID=A0A382MME6_9ZZZZ